MTLKSSLLECAPAGRYGAASILALIAVTVADEHESAVNQAAHQHAWYVRVQVVAWLANQTVAPACLDVGSEPDLPEPNHARNGSANRCVWFAGDVAMDLK